MAIGKKICEYCETIFYGTARARFCCDKCRLYAFREAKKTGKAKPKAA